MYEQSLKYHCQRYNNDSKQLFYKEEILTIFLFVGHELKYTYLKDIHNFAKKYLSDCFPMLMLYQTLVYRLNRMADDVTKLSILQSTHRLEDCDESTLIVDSLPTKTCTGRNITSKVLAEIQNKGYYATNNLYYHSLKVHLVSMRFKDRLMFLSMSENDLTVFNAKCILSLKGKAIFADRIYQAQAIGKRRSKKNTFLTPLKAVKAQ